MALPKKLVIMPNPALRELSRIVEDGDVDELEPVLARADINARNEHGMTALMRAAYHGRVQMVRALLEHGADPNVMRNDKFTALSLAAFFGHAEIVDILIEHGAKTDVATRFGTSPSVWAKARSFGDVARSLEKRNLERRKLDKPNVDKRSEETVPPVSERPTPVPRRVEPEPAPIVVRTLKAPPEIWDLVHEAPRNFNARAAFVARLGSQKALLTLGIVLVVAIGTVAVAMFYAKNRVSATATIPAPVVVQTPATTDVSPGTPVPETPPVATETLTAATEPPKPDVNPNTITRRSRSYPKPPTVLTEVTSEQSTVEPDVSTPPVAPPRIESRSPVPTDTKKSTTSPNSQIISGPKTTQPKAKVIQWP